jgi:hypothetical protein
MAMKHETLGTVEGVTIVLADSTLSGRFSREEMAEVFDLVTANMPNWKGRISTTIPTSLQDVAAAAIEFFTGSEATFEAEGMSGAYVRVRAAGYYAAGA